MKLQRIYSSKIYVTSNRKDRIHAAIQDPINAELVQQLSEYLDDTAKQELNLAKSEITPTDNAEEGDASVAPNTDNARPGTSGGGSSASFTGDVISDFGEEEQFDAEPSDDSEAEPAGDTEVAESTKVSGRSIKATSVIWTTIEDVVNECDIIQGTLNSREDTSGVSRLQVKDNELWIYYNDDINLNDIMISVIEVLNSTGYTYLAFSRLARSNNAIVFDVTLNNNNQVKSSEVVRQSV